MNKVITINLNGRAYQLEEAAYEILRKYLHQAAEKLGNNPDKEEIVTDLEQAIADKCEKFLNAHKTVMSTTEIEQIILEMGPVDGADTDKQDKDRKDQKSEKASGQTAPKRLYLIHEGAVISGVCNGLAAYFNIDVTLVRIIFVVLAILSRGIWIIVYLIMTVVIPSAYTSEEHAEAHGLPFNAQELIQRAREKYAHFDEEHKKHVQKYWKDKAKQYKEDKANHRQKAQEHRQRARQKAQEFKKHWETEWRKDWDPTNRQTNFNTAGSGIGLALLTIIMVLISLGWIIAIISLLTTGAVFGFVFVGVPLWVTIILLTCAYNILLLPIRSIKSSAYHVPRYNNGWFGLLDAIMWLTIIAIMGWLIWMYIPESHIFWDKIAPFLQQIQQQAQHQIQQATQQNSQQISQQLTQQQ